jgi:hypothetical protein
MKLTKADLEEWTGEQRTDWGKARIPHWPPLFQQLKERAFD